MMQTPELEPFVKACDGNQEQAKKKLAHAKAVRLEHSKLTIADVAEFYRTPSLTRQNPDGCLVLLEDFQGGVVRDNKNRPIVVSIGMQHGTAEEMQKQYAYLMQRILAHPTEPGQPYAGGQAVVIEVRPRDAGAPATFRFPDRDVRTLFDMQRDIFPETMFGTVNHFCGLPRAVTWAFKLVRPFMRKEVYDSMMLKPSFSHLPSHMPKSSMLSRWGNGGELDFDIDAWVEWRAKEEGIDLSELCPRGKGRAFDPKAAAAANEAAMSESLGTADGSITAAKLLAGEVGSSGAPPRKHGEVQKRGSGRGLFATVRWKPKLLSVSDVGLIYFDSLEETETNKAARIVPLGDEGTRAELRGLAPIGGGSSSKEMGVHFALVAPTREFLFATKTEAEAAEWVKAIEEEIKAAKKLREEMMDASDEISSRAEDATVGATATTVEALNLS